MRHILSPSAALFHADCRDALRELPDNSIDSCVTDPPYALVSVVKRFGAADAVPAKDYSGERPSATGAYMRASAGFMGKTWDTGETAFSTEFWAEVLRVLFVKDANPSRDEVIGAFPTTGASKRGVKDPNGSMGYHGGASGLPGVVGGYDDPGGSAARFFYSAKASKADRAGSKHPTVKPVSLTEWLCTLITPPGGTVLDPFAGSGTTGIAAQNKGFQVVLCEREAEYVEDIQRRFGGRPDKPLISASKVARFRAWNAKALELQAFLDIQVA